MLTKFDISHDAASQTKLTDSNQPCSTSVVSFVNLLTLLVDKGCQQLVSTGWHTDHWNNNNIYNNYIYEMMLHGKGIARCYFRQGGGLR